jgi:hypothetical protein
MKAEIIQRLLEGNHITAEEAVILLSENHAVVHPYSPHDPRDPYNPPFEITCNTKE